MDMDMPVMDGMQATKQIRTLESKSSTIQLLLYYPLLSTKNLYQIMMKVYLMRYCQSLLLLNQYKIYYKNILVCEFIFKLQFVSLLKIYLCYS